jgi:hypothetical protein
MTYPRASRVLVVVTFKLSSIDSVLRSIKTWAGLGSVELLAFLHQDDILLESHPPHLIEQLFNHVETYSCEYSRQGPPLTSKKSPTIAQIFDAMRRYPGYEYYAYVNSDIELIPACGDFDLPFFLDSVCSKGRLLLAPRRDYVTSIKACSVYRHGFDFFAVSSNLLCRLSCPQVAAMFRIGEAGWDYILPLSMRKDVIVIDATLPIYHAQHPTGSCAEWEQAMMFCMGYTDSSWFMAGPIKSLVLFALARCMGIHKQTFSVDCTSLSVSGSRAYFMSRLFFYLVVQPVLLSSARFC